MTVAGRVACVAAVLLAALLQVTIAFRIEVGGASPDVLVLVVVAIALLTGAISGAVTGFVAGVALATFAALPLGPHALLGTLVGYTIGRVGESLATDEHPVPPIAAGMAATFVMQVGGPLVEFLVSPTPATTDGLWVKAAISTLMALVLAMPIYLLVRRLLDATGGVTAHVVRERSA